MLRTNGQRAVVKDEKDIIEIITPFNLKVALLREEYDAAINGKILIEDDKAHTLSDKMALKLLKNKRKLENSEL